MSVDVSYKSVVLKLLMAVDAGTWSSALLVLKLLMAIDAIICSSALEGGEAGVERGDSSSWLARCHCLPREELDPATVYSLITMLDGCKPLVKTFRMAKPYEL